MQLSDCGIAAVIVAGLIGVEQPGRGPEEVVGGAMLGC